VVCQGGGKKSYAGGRPATQISRAGTPRPGGTARKKKKRCTGQHKGRLNSESPELPQSGVTNNKTHAGHVKRHFSVTRRSHDLNERRHSSYDVCISGGITPCAAVNRVGGAPSGLEESTPKKSLAKNTVESSPRGRNLVGGGARFFKGEKGAPCF